MISNSLSNIRANASESERLAAAMAEFERSRRVTVLEGAACIPPKRTAWVDPETILKRRRKRPTPADRTKIRRMTEGL